jgi:hypothetical protein
MNHSIKQGTIPPAPGLEKEEPELADEEDIPSDDSPNAGDEGAGADSRPNLERE